MSLRIEYLDRGPDDLGRRAFFVIGDDGRGQVHFRDPAELIEIWRAHGVTVEERQQ